MVSEARRGVQFPAVKVLAGNTLYIGHLGTPEQVVERFKYGLSEFLYDALFDAQKPKRKAAADAAASQAMTEADELSRNLNGHGDESFSLLNCQVWPASGGDGVEAAAVQVPYSAVDGWWIGSEKRLARKESSGGFFAGVLLPLPT